MGDRDSKRREQVVLGEEPAPAWGWVEGVGLVLTIGIVIARGMMLETLREPNSAVPGQMAPPAPAGAATTMVLNLLSCLPAVLVLVRRAGDGSRRLAGATAFAFGLALAAWAVISTAWAADRFAALVSACTLASAFVLMWSTAQLVRDWGRLRLVAGVCLGLLLVNIASGIGYRFIDLPEMVRRWEQDIDAVRTNTLREHGWSEGDVAARRFEQKLRAGEMIGYNASPNTFAALVITLGVVAAGLCIQRGRDRQWPSALPAAAAIALAAWLVTYTQSKTAAATPLAAAGLFALVALAGRRMARHRALAFSVGVCGFVLAVLAVVGHGLYHDSLVIESLTFRWRYWVASAAMFADHALAGVGYANFADFYTAYRPPVAAEEIRDPHNLFVRFFTELGLVGGVLAIGWMATTWWRLTRPAWPEADDRAAAGGTDRSLIALAAGSVVFGIFLSLVSAVDFTQAGAYVFLEVMKRLLYLCLLGTGMMLAVLRLRDGSVVGDDRPAPWLLYGLIIAIAVFLLHSLIDFAFFETGPLFLFMLLTGAAMGLRSPQATAAARLPRPVAIGAAVLAGVAWLVAAGTAVGPVLVAEDHAASGDAAIRAGRLDAAAARYAMAFNVLPGNSDYAHRAAQACLYAGQAAQARAWLDRALAANPRSTSALLLRARQAAQETPGGSESALADYARAVELNPHEIEIRIEYARALAAAGRPREALAQAEAALAVQAAYHPDEPERLPPARVEELRRFMATLGAD